MMEVEMKAPFGLSMCKRLQEIILADSITYFDVEIKMDSYYPCKDQSKQFRIRKVGVLSHCKSALTDSSSETTLEAFIKRYLLNSVIANSKDFMCQTFVTKKEKHINSEGIECNEEDEYEINPNEVASVLENNKGLTSTIPYFVKYKRTLSFHFSNGLHYELVKVTGVNSIFLEIETLAEDEYQAKDAIWLIKNAFADLGITEFEPRSWASLIQDNSMENDAMETKINISLCDNTEEICMQLSEKDVDNLLACLSEASKTTNKDEVIGLITKFTNLKNALHSEDD